MISEGKYNSLINQFEPVKLDEIFQLKLLKRVDQKFILPIDLISRLLDRVKNDYQILEIQGARDFEYFTRYYDTPRLDYYYNHQNQRANRYKIRTRDYLINNHSFLEVKQKTNTGQTIKSRMPIEKCSHLEKEHYEYLNSIVPTEGQELIKSADNSFRRITLVSFKSSERITIDYDISFTKNNKTINLPYISIIEVKRVKSSSTSPIALALKEFKVYSRSFSKYCIGLSYLNPELKQNYFKTTKLYLKKLEHATHIY